MRRVLIFTENREGTKRYLRAMLEAAITDTDRASERIAAIDGLTAEVRCHYFVLPQREEDRELEVLVRKTETIRHELGSLSQVIDDDIERRLSAGIHRHDAGKLAREIEQADPDARLLRGAGHARRARRPGLPLARDELRSALRQVRHVHDPVRQVGMPAHRVVKARVCGDYGVLLVHGESEIEAVVDRMTQIRRQPRGGGGKLVHRQRRCNRRNPQQVNRLGKGVAVDVPAAVHGPQRVGHLGEKQLRRLQRQARVQQTRRLTGEVFLDHPLHGDAGIDDVTLHVA